MLGADKLKRDKATHYGSRNGNEFTPTSPTSPSTSHQKRMPTDKSPQPKQIVANLHSYSNSTREEQKLITQICNERKKNEKTF
jgi:hypothetical protein